MLTSINNFVYIIIAINNRSTFLNYSFFLFSAQFTFVKSFNYYYMLYMSFYIMLAIDVL